VNAIAECTVSEKILLAAYALEEAGHSPFTAEALVVSAWKKYPATFGLKAFADHYPDSNKVLTSIMGERGLARRGWLSKVGQKLYALTREGRQSVRRLLRADDQPAAVTAAAGPVRLSRENERFLQTVLGSTALAKFREGREGDLTFADACRFWGVTENLFGAQLTGHLEQVKATLTDLDRQLGLGHCVLTGGRSVSGTDISLLGDLNAHLEQRFRRHLNLLLTRTTRT
jgi:hypothetical protein